MAYVCQQSCTYACTPHPHGHIHKQIINELKGRILLLITSWKENKATLQTWPTRVYQCFMERKNVLGTFPFPRKMEWEFSGMADTLSVLALRLHAQMHRLCWLGSMTYPLAPVSFRHLSQKQRHTSLGTTLEADHGPSSALLLRSTFF